MIPAHSSIEGTLDGILRKGRKITFIVSTEYGKIHGQTIVFRSTKEAVRAIGRRGTLNIRKQRG